MHNQEGQSSLSEHESNEGVSIRSADFIKSVDFPQLEGEKGIGSQEEMKRTLGMSDFFDSKMHDTFSKEFDSNKLDDTGKISEKYSDRTGQLQLIPNYIPESFYFRPLCLLPKNEEENAKFFQEYVFRQTFSVRKLISIFCGMGNIFQVVFIVVN